MPIRRGQSIDVKRGHSRPRKRKILTPEQTKRIDAATLAASIQFQEEKRELIYSCMALTMKIGLLVLGAASLLKLGVASQKRLDGHSEIRSVLNVESARLISLQKRFDNLFTIGGDRRLMDEQDQWIAPDRVRVIWK